MNAIEKIVLTKLEKYKEKANRDRVVLPLKLKIKDFLFYVLPRENDISLFTSIINQSINFYYICKEIIV